MVGISREHGRPGYYLALTAPFALGSVSKCRAEAPILSRGRRGVFRFLGNSARRLPDDLGIL